MKTPFPELLTSGGADEPRAACANRWWLWLSLDADAHREAAEGCAECPAIEWCRGQLKDALADPSYGLGVHGTWAGVLYKDGRRVSGQTSVGTCPQCGAKDGRVCVSDSGSRVGAPHRARSMGLPKCAHCSTTFTPSRSRLRYCSAECSQKGHRAMRRKSYAKEPTKACETCLGPTRGRLCVTCAAKKGNAARREQNDQPWGSVA